MKLSKQEEELYKVLRRKLTKNGLNSFEKNLDMFITLHEKQMTLNTTYIKSRITKYKKRADKCKIEGKKKKLRAIQEEFEDCLNTVTGNTTGYLMKKS